MKKIIEDFYESQNNGLRVLVAPTGLGKTYSWTEAICDMLSAEKNGVTSESQRRFIFVTPFRKNLPFNQLRDKLIERGILSAEEYDLMAIDLKSNKDSVIEYFDSVKDDIERNNAMVRRSSQYLSLKADIEFIQKYKDGACEPTIYNQKKLAIDRLREETEPAFRNFISGYFKSKYKTKKERLSVIVNERKWSWLPVLYPSMYLEDKRIIFMSLDKFLSKNTSIIGPNYFIWKSPEITKDACILFDEFDSTKEKIFQRIIERSLDGRNLVDLFVTCYNALNQNAEDFLDGLNANKDAFEAAAMLRENANKIYEEFHLDRRFTMSESETQTSFIFNSGETHTFSSNGDYTCACAKLLENRNEIYFAPKGQTDRKDKDVATMVDRITGFKENFKRWLYALSIVYCKEYNRMVKSGEKADKDILAIEDAISTVVSRVFKSESWQEYFADELMEMSFPVKAKIHADKDSKAQKFTRSKPLSETNNPLVDDHIRYDYDFSSRGFTFYEFNNARSHNEDTYIQMYQCNETPERILIELCSRAKVIGLSATGDARTVLKNYDFEYLKRHIGVDTFFPPQEDMGRIIEKAKDNRIGYGPDGIMIHTDKVSAENASDYNTWLDLFDGDRSYTDLLFTKYFGRSANEYTLKRYFKIARVFKTFWENYDSIPLGYVMLNKIPKQGDSGLDETILYGIFGIIMETSNAHPRTAADGKASEYVKILAGDNFDIQKERFFETFLKDGKHKLIITTYITAGAGQNLQYSLEENDSENLKDVKVIGDGIRRVKDGHLIEVDANLIYLEKPTYVIQNKQTFGDLASFYKALIQISSMRQSGSITEYQFNRLICDSFAFRSEALRRKIGYDDDVQPYRSSDYEKMYTTPDHYAAVDLVCEQAIGRICRTKHKHENIYILVDEDLEIGCYRNPAHEGLTTPEFDAVSAMASNPLHPETDIAVIKANDQEGKARRFVHRALTSLMYNKDNIYNWQMTRRLVISHPTISEKDYLKLRTWEQNLYLRLPRPGNKYYFQTSDPEGFSNCTIHFGRAHECCEVSEDAAKLAEVMKCPDIKAWFEKQGFATEFKMNEYILCPIIFRNIYQGALGEYVGEYLMKNCGICVLGDVCHDAYEFFDYQVVKDSEDEPTICFDFKNWHESTVMSANEIYSKITGKAKDYPEGVDAVIVANLSCIGTHKLTEHVESYTDSEGNGRAVRILTVPRMIQFGKTVSENLERIRTFINDVKTKSYGKAQD